MPVSRITNAQSHRHFSNSLVGKQSTLFYSKFDQLYQKYCTNWFRHIDRYGYHTLSLTCRHRHFVCMKMVHLIYNTHIVKNHGRNASVCERRRYWIICTLNQRCMSSQNSDVATTTIQCRDVLYIGPTFIHHEGSR